MQLKMLLPFPKDFNLPEKTVSGSSWITVLMDPLALGAFPCFFLTQISLGAQSCLWQHSECHSLVMIEVEKNLMLFTFIFRALFEILGGNVQRCSSQ